MNKASNVNNMHNGHEFVDLGLPSGLLWATCNVGATSPEQAGLYFAWGETEGFTAEQVKAKKRKFNWSECRFHGVNKYLLPTDDAARVNMGGKWRMPTKDENQELIDNCSSTWTKDYNGTGVAGRLLRSKNNGKFIFLPAAGDCYNFTVGSQNWWGKYWSASCLSPTSAWGLNFYSEIAFVGGEVRCYGQSVRGVCEK